MSDVVFLDCEFTNLAAPVLLSVGMVSLKGERFYCEYDLNSVHGVRLKKLAVHFVKEMVFPMFKLVPGSSVTIPADLARRAANWIDTLEPPVYVGYDYGVDFTLLEEVLMAAGLWDRIGPLLVPMHLGYLWGTFDCDTAAQRTWDELDVRSGLRRHHALADALALRAAYLAMHGVD